jgi:hypothetical protein
MSKIYEKPTVEVVQFTSQEPIMADAGIEKPSIGQGGGLLPIDLDLDLGNK